MISALLATALWAVPATAQPADVLLMRAWYVQNDVCRGDGRACDWRDDTQMVLERRGWEWSSRYGWRRVR